MCQLHLNPIARKLLTSDIIQGAGKVSKNDIILGQASSTGMQFDPKVNKSEYLTYLSTNIGPRVQLGHVLYNFTDS